MFVVSRNSEDGNFSASLITLGLENSAGKVLKVQKKISGERIANMYMYCFAGLFCNEQIFKTTIRYHIGFSVYCSC